MNTQTQEALKMAIEGLESANKTILYAGYIYDETWIGKRALQACKEALAQPAQEPLSEDEINKIAIDCGFETRMKNIVVRHSNGSWIEVSNRLNELTRAIEKAHGIG